MATATASGHFGGAMTWKTARLAIDLSTRGRIMGILNVTPDSFSDGGKYGLPDSALAHARHLIREGADLLDIGGESTRPGAEPVPADEEIARTVPVIAAIRREWGGPISIDTSKPEVAEAALLAGADIVNDVNGLRAPGMAECCARHRCGVVVMHMQGEPRTMQSAPRYDDVVAEVRDFFEERLATLGRAGIGREHLVWDPGIGFGKTLEHNLTLLRSLPQLAVAGRPLLIGVSRKSFIGKILGGGGPEDRDRATVALTARTREGGAMIHRVHEVRANAEALRMTEAILHGAAGE